MTPPRVAARGMGVGGRFCGASGAPPPTGCPGTGGGGRSRRGGGTPPYVWGDMETLWGLREQSFPGRRAVGAGHARPGGLRRQASMVRSVGRGLDPSAGVGGSGRLRGWLPGGRAAAGACPSSGPAGPPSPTGEGKGCCWRQRKPPRGVGDAAPYGLPEEGR